MEERQPITVMLPPDVVRVYDAEAETSGIARATILRLVCMGKRKPPKTAKVSR